MKKSFNKEELTIMRFYNCDDRNKLINKLDSVLENADDLEIKSEVEEIVNKLRSMTDTEFNEIDLKDILEIEEEI